MTEDRMREILNNILAWGFTHDKEFIECLVNSMNLTEEERHELLLDFDDDDYERSWGPRREDEEEE